MPFTRTSYIRLLRIILAIVLVIIIVAYAIWRSLNYARGPAITILEPSNGSAVSESSVVITGHADRVNNLLMNGQPISMDQNGGFNQTIIVFPGVNLITFSASDQFGRDTENQLEIVGMSDFKIPSSTSTAASTTTASSTTQADR